MSLLDVTLVALAGLVWMTVTTPLVTVADRGTCRAIGYPAALREAVSSAAVTWLLGCALVLLSQQALSYFVTRGITGWVGEIVSGLVMLSGFAAVLAAPVMELMRNDYLTSESDESSLLVMMQRR